MLINLECLFWHSSVLKAYFFCNIKHLEDNLESAKLARVQCLGNEQPASIKWKQDVSYSVVQEEEKLVCTIMPD